MKPSLLLLLTLLLPLSPQDPTTRTLTYKGGETVNAQVLSLQGDTVKLRVFILGGQMQVQRKLADFAPLSAFAIEMEAARPVSFEDHFRLAKRAAELSLVPQAGQQARAAIESVKDPTDQAARRAEVRTWAADALEKVLRQAIADGKRTEAQHYLKLLTTRLADQRSEEQLEALSEQVQELEAKVAQERQAAAQAKLEAKVKADIDRRLQPIRKHIEDGDKKQREAIKKSRSTVASSNLCEKAIDSYRAAWKTLQELVEKHPDDADLAQEASTLGEHLHDSAIRAALHAANMLTVQSDYKGAMDWANKVLAFEPDNAEAKEMVRTIQLASAAASGEWAWGWRTAGGGGSGSDPRNR